jgi:phosphate transport system substrate-binding protein
MHTFGHQKIQVFGRSATSGTYQYFRRAALCDGDPGVFTNEIPGSSGVVNTVARLPTGLAYAPQAQVDKGVKTLNIIARDGRILSPSAPDYPFKRVLYMYTVTSLANAKDSTECRFIEFIAGSDGARIIACSRIRATHKSRGLPYPR